MRAQFNVERVETQKFVLRPETSAFIRSLAEYNNSLYYRFIIPYRELEPLGIGPRDKIQREGNQSRGRARFE